MSLRWALCSLLILAATAADTTWCQDSESADSLARRVDSLFSEWDKPTSPGCAVGVIRDGRLIYKRGYGMANLENSVPIASTTVFLIGSTSKQFTAASILLAESQGYLSLDDDIRSYLPEMPDYGDPITIRHLMHHTSGIRGYFSLSSLAGEDPGNNIVTNDQIIAFLGAHARKSPPGLKFFANMVKIAMQKHKKRGQPFLGFRLE